MPHDVIVIGAGYAGVTAAVTLADAGADVLLVEARDRVGGRTLSERLPDGTLVDHGGQWAGPTQRRLLALAEREEVATFPTHDTGENVEWRDGTPYRYTGPIPSSDPEAVAESITYTPPQGGGEQRVRRGKRRG